MNWQLKKEVLNRLDCIFLVAVYGEKYGGDLGKI
jgi:hypothetical protein